MSKAEQLHEILSENGIEVALGMTRASTRKGLFLLDIQPRFSYI